MFGVGRAGEAVQSVVPAGLWRHRELRIATPAAKRLLRIVDVVPCPVPARATSGLNTNQKNPKFCEIRNRTYEVVTRILPRLPTCPSRIKVVRLLLSVLLENGKVEISRR